MCHRRCSRAAAILVIAIGGKLPHGLGPSKLQQLAAAFRSAFLASVTAGEAQSC
jgi:hypothetical protein